MEFSPLSTETGIITVEVRAWHAPAAGLGASAERWASPFQMNFLCLYEVSSERLLWASAESGNFDFSVWTLG